MKKLRGYTIGGYVSETAENSFTVEIPSLEGSKYRSYYEFSRSLFPFPIKSGDNIKIVKRLRSKQVKVYKIKMTRSQKSKMDNLFKNLKDSVEDEF